MPALGNYIHGLNLKFGIYSGAGTWQCHPEGNKYLIQASLGHETADAQTFADWGGDYLK
jgi:alpha-galactosidase